MSGIWEIMRAIDDADLDVYQYRMLMHFLRVGESWEGLRTLAEQCNMSIGKASQVRAWLEENEWIKLVKTDEGRIARVVNVDRVHEVKRTVANVHDMKQGVHDMKNGVHDMNVSIPIEDKPIEDEDEVVGELARHFTGKTSLFASMDNWEDKWRTPLLAIYNRTGDVDSAKQLITKAIEFARDGPKGKRYTITSPMSITTIAANLPLNGSGKHVKVRTR